MHSNSQTINTKSIGMDCSFCRRDFHIKYVDINKQTYDYIKTNELFWKCDGCTKKNIPLQKTGNNENLTQLIPFFGGEHKIVNRNIKGTRGKNRNVIQNKNSTEITSTTEDIINTEYRFLQFGGI